MKHAFLLLRDTRHLREVSSFHTPWDTPQYHHHHHVFFLLFIYLCFLFDRVERHTARHREFAFLKIESFLRFIRDHHHHWRADNVIFLSFFMLFLSSSCWLFFLHKKAQSLGWMLELRYHHFLFFAFSAFSSFLHIFQLFRNRARETRLRLTCQLYMPHGMTFELLTMRVFQQMSLWVIIIEFFRNEERKRTYYYMYYFLFQMLPTMSSSIP